MKRSNVIKLIDSYLNSKKDFFGDIQYDEELSEYILRITEDVGMLPPGQLINYGPYDTLPDIDQEIWENNWEPEDDEPSL